MNGGHPFALRGPLRTLNIRPIFRPWCWLFGHEVAPLWFFYDRGWVCPRCDGVAEPWLATVIRSDNEMEVTTCSAPS